MKIGKVVENWYPNNEIHSNKYTKWNFIPKNLLTQFSKLANIYFVVICILQIIPAITISNGAMAMLPPLVFVIIAAMSKDGYEDY